MDIVKYHPGLAEPICELYNKTIEPVVHCHPVSTAVFAKALEPVLQTQSCGPKNMRSQYCLAAMEDETLTGFAHAGAYNHRAFVFYSNFGFKVSDWTYGWSKKL